MSPARGEVWRAELDPVRGREQAGERPILVVSTDTFNRGPADLAVILPLTTARKKVRWHVEVSPPEGVVAAVSFVKCEDVGSISKDRLSERWGEVSEDVMRAVEDRLRILLQL